MEPIKFNRRAGPRPVRSAEIHPTAVVHADAKLGHDVQIGPHAVIGARLCRKFGESPTVINAVGGHHRHNVLLRHRLPGGCGARYRPRGGGAAPLAAGVHIGSIVDTDIEDIIAALQHSRKGAKSDIKCSPISSDSDHAGVVSPLGPQGGGAARPDGA